MIEIEKDGGKVLVHGTTVPVDTTPGYAPGCIFVDVDGGVGATMFVNQGTLASSNFDVAL